MLIHSFRSDPMPKAVKARNIPQNVPLTSIFWIQNYCMIVSNVSNGKVMWAVFQRGDICKWVELAQGGSVTNGATSSSLSCKTFQTKVFTFPVIPVFSSHVFLLLFSSYFLFFFCFCCLFCCPADLAVVGVGGLDPAARSPHLGVVPRPAVRVFLTK